MAIASINPATGELLQAFQPLHRQEIEARLTRAADAFAFLRATRVRTRAQLLARVADLLETHADDLASIITREMGKLITGSVSEVQKCARACRYYAAGAARILADEAIPTNAARSYVRYEPLGAILAIMPWNFPFWQVFRFAAPAIAGGNVGLLKHAPNVPQCALAIESLFETAGFPPGVLQALLIGVDQVPAVIADDRVAAVTLTGSERAGSAVAGAAGKVVKKAVLELGGSDPFIVMPSASLEAAVSTGVAARVINNGQSCIAAKRFIVHDAIADEFEARFVAAIAALRIGDPRDPLTEIGPLASEAVVATLDRQVRDTIRAGGRLLIGGARIDGPGWYYAPTVLTDIPVDSPAHRDEVFGPVAALYRTSGIDDAIRLANDSRFGLGASVWTNDEAERDRFIAELEVGQVFVNAMVASDPSLPFGGVKRSGYGRELGEFGLREFMNIKTVWIGPNG